MAQIQSPETYADGQQVTASRLNNQTNGAVLLPGAVTDQTALAAGTVATGDQVILHDASTTALRKATAGDLLGSDLPITTSAVTAGANSDIVITPNDGTIVTGQAYTSGDGLTVTVTSTAHTLAVGQVILVTAAATGYNGTFRVATVATNSFTYVMATAATPGSSTLSYTKKGSVRNAGNESVAGSLFVAGSAVLAGTNSITGATAITGALTSSGIANFTGALQVNGTVGYALVEVVEETIAVNITTQGALNTNNTYFTSASYTKPVDEIWVIEVCANLTHNSGSYLGVRLKQSSTSSIIDGDFFVDFVDTVRPNKMNRFHAKGVISAATTFTSTFVIEASLYGSGTHGIGHTNYSSALAGVLTTFDIAPSVFRIYKYKTA